MRIFARRHFPHRGPLGSSIIFLNRHSERDRQRRIEDLGRPAATVLRLHQFLQRRGLTTIPSASRHLGLSQPTVTSAIAHLQTLGVVRETTGRQRGKIYVYGAFLDLLSEGTDPLPR